MSFTVDQAYAQIKNLENSGQLKLPQPQATVEVGTVNASTGAFTWTVPTFVRTTVIPPNPQLGQKTNTFINETAGLVTTSAVDLILKFAVTGIQVKNAPPAAAAAVKVDAAKVVTNVGNLGLGSVLATGNGGVTVTGFPTIASGGPQVLVDAGLAASATIPNDPNTTPAITLFSVTINVPGKPQTNINLAIVRPPVLGIGAFTLPAVPMTVVYAPPQGKQAKNTSTYTDMTSFKRTVTTSITNSNNTKTAQAYTAADLVGKVASAITAVVAIVGTGGAGAGAGAGAGGIVGSLVQALVGNTAAQNDSSSVADDLKTFSSDLSLVSTILNSVNSSTGSDSQTLTIENDHSISLTVTDTTMLSSATGLGPGVGDRIVYLANVRVVWMAVNGDVGIHVLGYQNPAAYSAQALNQDLQTLASGGTPASGLDAATIKMLLNYDPFCIQRPVIVALEPPLVGPPRFVPANPPERMGAGTGPSGDQFSVSFDLSTDNKQTQTSVHTTITDAKPGWVSVLFGADNTETTTTMTLTNAQSTDTTTDEKITNQVTLFSQDATDPYDVMIFYDRTFGTFLFANKGAPVLQGSTGVFQEVSAVANKAGAS